MSRWRAAPSAALFALFIVAGLLPLVHHDDPSVIGQGLLVSLAAALCLVGIWRESHHDQ